MGLPANTPRTLDIVPEVCRRAGSTAYIASSIRREAGAYVVGLKAVNCQSGKLLADEQVRARSKDDALDALGEATTRLRAEVGEPAAQVWKYSVPLTQITSSLDALNEYALAQTPGLGEEELLRHEQRAVELDPSFAVAWSDAGRLYLNLGQVDKGAAYLSRAFELQDHAMEFQKQEIAGMYYTVVTGELNKAVDTYQSQVAIYPKLPIAYSRLSIAFSRQGQYQKAAEMERQAIVLSPNDSLGYGNLAFTLLALQRLKEAQETLQAALARKPDVGWTHMELYALAFLAGDSHAMSDQLAWLRGQPPFENEAFELEADTNAYAGHLRKARALARQGVDSALRNATKEQAATRWNGAALREAAFGNTTEARQAVTEAIKLAPDSEDVQLLSGFILASLGDAAGAESLAQTVNKRSPLDTWVQSLWLPTIEAQLELTKKNPRAAIERLQAVASIELGSVGVVPNSCLWAVDVRGTAYLGLGDGRAAAAEFQKMIDHSGIVENCYTGALAHLKLGRAYAMAGDPAKARAAYNDFFAVWKDADPDIPVLKQAKAEYAILH